MTKPDFHQVIANLRASGMNPGKILAIVIVVYIAFAALTGLCWQFSINTWLEWADKTENAIGFGTAFLIGLIPWVNIVGLSVFLITLLGTFIVPLFI